MPAERITMRHVREVLRLKFVGHVPTREIARRIGVAASTVRTTLERFHASGLSWPLPEEMTDAMLEARLFANAGTKQGHRRHIEPDWAAIHRELKRKHVTLSILWDEYIERDPQGYRYSRFCELYRSWEARLSVTMRQTHVGGDKLFVDYAGDTVPVIIDRLSGSLLICDRAATTSTRPSPNTCRPVIAAMPTGPSIAFARKRPASGRQPPRCANSSWNAGLIPNRAFAPAGASCVWCARSASNASKPQPHAPSISARSATDLSVPSSTTS